MTRLFSSLTPQEALHVAISIEERNAAVYHRFAAMFAEFRDPESLEISSVFWDMAVEEKRHQEILQECYRERFGELGCTLTEDDVQEMIEVPRLDDGDVFAVVEANRTMARERALRVALEAEKRAHDFYARLVEQTSHEPLRRLYTELSMMEDSHVTYLQTMLEESAVGSEKELQ
jgi:rubrerythrin